MPRNRWAPPRRGVSRASFSAPCPGSRTWFSARWLGTWLGLSLGIAACSPTVKVQAPKEPITINLNIKLDAEVRVKLEETAQKDIKSHPDIF